MLNTKDKPRTQPSIAKNIKRVFIRLGVELLPFFPVPKEWYRKILVHDSDRRYVAGRWAYMNEAAEAHRYSLISGCCEFFTSQDRKVLDIGCGEGILHARIKYQKYIGVDSNTLAIQLAKGRQDEKTIFIQCPAEVFQPESTFDVIVFNEYLSYLKDPSEVVNRYRKYLAPDGILVICMFQIYLARQICQQLSKLGLNELTAVKISNELGFASVIKAFRN